MRHLLTILAALLLCSAPLHAQTLKSLMYNSTNGQVVANTGTNVLTFTNEINAGGIKSAYLYANIGTNTYFYAADDAVEIRVPLEIYAENGINFNSTNAIAATRANLGFSTNLNTLWTATNASNARSAVGLGATWLTNTTTSAFRSAIGTPSFAGSGDNSVIGGGVHNADSASGSYSVIGGGFSNVVSQPYSFIGGGWQNTASSTYSVVGGGRFNTAGGSYSAIAGGESNQAIGSHSFAGGRFALATNTGSWVWADYTPNETFSSTNIDSFNIRARGGLSLDLGTNGIIFRTNASAAATRTNLGLGETNAVTFAGLTNNGDITINGTTATNGLLYIRRTNNEAFLGLANLIASNNTTVSNETLFRVGVAELTNKSAQFGFRSTNTNGNGVAVFSVFGFNALMQIGADASTNAVIYSGGGTNNEVMTLIRDGATEFARPLRFSTNAASKPATNAPANTTNVAAWVEMQIGTNSYRVPLYQ